MLKDVVFLYSEAFGRFEITKAAFDMRLLLSYVVVCFIL